MKSATSSAPPLPTYTQFPHYDNKYFCCCGIHVLKGAKIVGIIQLVLFSIIVLCTLGVASPFLLIPVCLLVGVSKHRAGYLIPWMVFTTFSLALRIAAFWFCVIVIAKGRGNDPTIGALLMIPIMASFCLDTWQLITVYRCYGYLNDLEEHIRVSCPTRHDVYTCPPTVPYSNHV